MAQPTFQYYAQRVDLTGSEGRTCVGLLFRNPSRCLARTFSSLLV